MHLYGFVLSWTHHDAPLPYPTRSKLQQTKKDVASPPGTLRFKIYIFVSVDVSAEHINLFLSKCKNANWAGVFYSPPFNKDFQFLLQDLNTIQPETDEQFIFHPFDHSLVPSIVLHPQYKNEQAIQHLKNEVTSSTYWESPLLKAIESTTQEEYEENFKNYQANIRSGNCSKAILSTIIKKDIPDAFNIGAYILKLREAYPQAFIYVLSSPMSGTWIGATPETLIKWEPSNVSTMSLAGTKKKDDPHFRFGEKEKTEQKIVTDYIQQIFEQKFGGVKVEKPTEFIYGAMVHLITKFIAKPSIDFCLNDLLALAHQLHPTPAVGGYPKKEAGELIRSTEKHLRLYYSGYLGPVSGHCAELAVNLRCMCVTAQHLYVFAGGGITVDSIQDAEWQETRLKAEALLKFL